MSEVEPITRRRRRPTAGEEFALDCWILFHVKFPYLPVDDQPDGIRRRIERGRAHALLGIAAAEDEVGLLLGRSA